MAQSYIEVNCRCNVSFSERYIRSPIPHKSFRTSDVKCCVAGSQNRLNVSIWSLLLAALLCTLVLLKRVRKNECTSQKELVSVRIISGDEVIMNVTKNVISSTRDKENTPAYQVSFGRVRWFKCVIPLHEGMSNTVPAGSCIPSRYIKFWNEFVESRSFSEIR